MRGDGIAAATADLTARVGPDTRVLSIGNGMAQLQTLRDAFGDQRVVGAAAEMATSLVDGIIEVSTRGAAGTTRQIEGFRGDSRRRC